MAKVDEDLDLDVESGKKKGGGKMKSILIFSLIGVLLIGFSVTLTLLLIGGGKETAPAADKHNEAAAEHSTAAASAKPEHNTESAVSSGASVAYMELSPAFVVNLNGKESTIRYLQINMSVMVGKESDLEIVKKHTPVLRHHLNLLFSSLDFNDISTREGKNKLTEESLKVVRDALQKAAGSPIVEAVYFNSIVGQ